MSWLRRFRPKADPTPKRTVWCAKRSDGMYWAGEYMYFGRTFTDYPPNIYRWGTRQACQAAIDAWGFANVIPEQVEFDSSVKRPNIKRYNHYRGR
jgi:hypothetical protein